MAYLPNKKILFLIVFILLVFAGWFYFSDYENKQVQYIAEKEKSPFIVVPEPTSLFASSTSDWLLTLPQNNSSDKEDVLAKTNQSLEGAADTMTASYAKQFLTNYLLLKQTKGELTQEDKQNLVDATMKGIKPLAVTDKYAISDLKISNDTSKESIKKYSDEIKKIFINIKSPRVSEEDVFNDLIKSIKENNAKNTESDIKALNIYASLSGDISKIILYFVVPDNLSNYHLEAVNGYNNLKFAIENTTIAKTDPVKAMMGQKLYDEQMQRVYNALKNIQRIFNEYEIAVFK